MTVAVQRIAGSAGIANRRRVVVIGQENSGKSQLITALTGARAYVANFAGSTVSCETFSTPNLDIIDTPGILLKSDTETTRLAIEEARGADLLLVVVKATHIDRSLASLLPLAAGRPAVLIVTFTDKIPDPSAGGGRDAMLEATERRLRRAIGAPVFAVDARNITASLRDRVLRTLRSANEPLKINHPFRRIGWDITARQTWLELRGIGPILAAALLLLPAVIAVGLANRFAELTDPMVQAAVKPLVAAARSWPAILGAVLTGRYGLVTMGPLLLVWALPTVVTYAVLLGVYKASGLLDRLTVAVHPLTRPLGLSGRDTVRILMGFGCNVPAVINTRACSSCSRGTCVSAIAFGSACSYQLGATLAVFAKTGTQYLVVPYLLYLVATTLIYARLISTPAGRSAQNTLQIGLDAFLEIPRPMAVFRECRVTILHFMKKAVPIFLAIIVIASLLDYFGVIEAAGRRVAPIMAVFNLPGEAVTPILMASIRKDGILLFADSHLAARLAPGQLLAAVYLAGVLLPCLVTWLTIVRERSLRFGAVLAGRQALAAAAFSLLLSWGPYLFSRPLPLH